MKYRIFILLLFIFVPVSASAQVVINEIMYDLDGSDSAREWIEVHNTGSNAVDLSDWRLFEADINHKLTVSQGNALIPPQGYAVIADNAVTFLNDNLGFSGTVFDSSFSLKNTGEFIALRDADLNDIDSVSYLSDWGGDDDGNSLQWSGSDWNANTPTPGKVNSSVDVAPPPPPEEEEEVSPPPASSSSSSSSSSVSTPKAVEFITVDAGTDRITTVGAAEFFGAEAYKKSGEVHPYVDYRWNFGNGVIREGKKVLHQYNYPGTYVVLITGITGDKLAATDRIVVEAKPVALSISAVGTGFIELFNASPRELNLSLWSLRSGDQHFLFPTDTILMPNAHVTFSNSVTGLTTTNIKAVALLYPNGMIASTYGAPPVASFVGQRVSAQVVQTAPIVYPDSVESNIDEETNSKQSAIALGSVKEGGSSLYLWLLALFALLSLAIVTVLMLEKKNKGDEQETKEEPKEKELKADDFTILEDK